jgi:aerobic C4-dicarboxylate transport protein
MSEARAITNLIGNGVATLAVARWGGELDVARLRAALARPTTAGDAATGDAPSTADAAKH